MRLVLILFLFIISVQCVQPWPMILGEKPRKLLDASDCHYSLRRIHTICISDVDKRFKKSPFAWTNPLSGYLLVLIRSPDAGEAHDFQLRLVKDPGSYSGANRDFRAEYVMKWLEDKSKL